MNLQRLTPALSAMLCGILSAPSAAAGPGNTQHRAHSAGGHSQARSVAPSRAQVLPLSAYRAAPLAYAPGAYYAPSYASYAPSYASSRAPAYRQPSVYFVPPLDPNAPRFSFDGSPAVVPDWGWQRVNLAQLAAEVRAKREAGAKP